MEIRIQSTTQIVEMNGAIKCRVWEGVTERGVRVQVLVPRIAALAGQDLRQFEAELEEHAPPSADVRAFPLRLIL